MKRAICMILGTLAILCALGSSAEARLVFEWNFASATDTLGWAQAEPITRFGVENGALVAVAGPGKPKFESPIFELEASPWQYVEVELKTDTSGMGLMYYSNTTEPPYNGFRPGLYTTFDAVGDGEWHTYVIQPFWHRQGKVIHIRLDPPGTRVAIGAVRIYDVKPALPPQKPSWRFERSDAGWCVLGPHGRLDLTDAGLKITGDQKTCVLSPSVNFDADEHLYATLRIVSQVEQVAQFRWASSESDGMHSYAIPLKGDGRVHTYVLDLYNAPRWSGKIIAVGLTPTDSASERSIILESLTIGDRPIGPPELEIAHLGLDYPICRVGQKAKLVARVRNIGGSRATSIVVEARLINPAKQEVAVLERRRLDALDPLTSSVFEWDFEVEDEASRVAVCRVFADELDPVEKSASLRFYPKLDREKFAGLKYVPEPVPADTGKYLVGCYYFPGWHTYERWSVLDEFPERKPVLGYYREGDPEVADWHIKWALEHGIGFFIYDWYWDRGRRQLEHALHNGFFKSKYQDRMKFCLLWANHNPENSSSEQDCLDVTRYWIENYFNRPNYLKINGKNVVVIFSTYRLTQDMGSEAVRATFDKMRKMCEDAGVGGLYLIACTYPGKDRIETLLREGYDALSGYNYPHAGNRGLQIAPYEWMVEGYKEIWNQIADAATIPYIPVCEPGWDARPWHGYNSLVRTGKSPELWKRMLENARAFVDDPKHPQHSERKLVFLEAWNEFGEGDYIEPHAEYGFDYLEAVRQVFAPSSRKPDIVVPRDIGLGPYDIPKPEPRTAWDFSNPADQLWTVGNMTDLAYADGVMSAVAQNNDPAFYSPATSIDADRFKVVEIKMRMDRGTQAQLFFTRPRGAMSEDKSVRFAVVGDGEWHVYAVDLSQNKKWRGVIGQIRLDPNSEPGSRVEIAYIRFK